MNRSHMNQMFMTLACATAISIGWSSSPSQSAAQEAGYGNLTGQIVVRGEVPANPPEDVAGSADKAVCLVDGKVPLDDAIVVNDKNQLQNVFVLMYISKQDKGPEKYHPSYDEAKAVKLTLDNVKCRFVPKALFARPGQTLILKNSDNVGHNCHITTMRHGHNPNIPAHQEVEITLDDESDTAPGQVKCDIHKWMDSIILIRDNPYVAITDEEGKFTIENIPAGDWKFHFWHKEIGYLKTIEIDGYEPEGRKATIEPTIKSGETLDLGTLTLPAEAFSN